MHLAESRRTRGVAKAMKIGYARVSTKEQSLDICHLADCLAMRQKVDISLHSMTQGRIGTHNI
jgi:hypothetical protein